MSEKKEKNIRFDTIENNADLEGALTDLECWTKVVVDGECLGEKQTPMQQLKTCMDIAEVAIALSHHYGRKAEGGAE